MYAYIRGRLEAKQNDLLIVEAGGIGYRIHTALSSIESAGMVGSEVKVYTHLHVREDAMSLFGFITQEELGMFELLLTVSGVGPKAALSLISAIPPSKFSLAVVTDDVKTITKAQGVGTKLAQRVILELKDKIKKEQLASLPSNDFGGVSSGGSKANEAISALMVLGYSAVEAGRAVAAVYSDDMDLETIIRNSLKRMGNQTR